MAITSVKTMYQSIPVLSSPATCPPCPSTVFQSWEKMKRIRIRKRLPAK